MTRTGIRKEMEDEFVIPKGTQEIIPRATFLLKKFDSKLKEDDLSSDGEDDDMLEKIHEQNRAAVPRAQGACVIENISFLLTPTSTEASGPLAESHSVGTKSLSTVKNVLPPPPKDDAQQDNNVSILSDATSVTANTRKHQAQEAMVPLAIWQTSDAPWQGQVRLKSKSMGDEDSVSTLATLDHPVNNDGPPDPNGTSSQV